MATHGVGIHYPAIFAPLFLSTWYLKQSIFHGFENQAGQLRSSLAGKKTNQSPEIFTTKCGNEILTVQGAVSVLKDRALSYDSYTPYRIFYHSHPTAERTLESLDYLPEEDGKKLA